jgi:hypothetical protein
MHPFLLSWVLNQFVEQMLTTILSLKKKELLLNSCEQENQISLNGCEVLTKKGSKKKTTKT